MERELEKLLNEYSYNEIVQAINSLADKKEGEFNGESVVHSRRSF